MKPAALLMLTTILFVACSPSTPELIKIQQITQGPNHHWFGYYDKWQFDPTGRYVLGNQVDFEGRSPRADDVIKVGMVDLQDNNRWIELGESRAWNWQQGCMLQWRPGTKSQVVWNDQVDGQFVCHILNIETGEKRTIPRAIYTISPDGTWAMAPDFERIQDMRPGYGYAGIADPNARVLRPDNAGIYKINLETGKSELVISIDQIANIPFEQEDLSDAKHYFNHLLFNTDGSRFIFLHRWRNYDSELYKNVGGFGTRMLTASPDGQDIRVIDPYGYTSHFIWRDPHFILAWAQVPTHGRAFYLFKDADQENIQPVGLDVMTRNGHCTYLPGNEWILNDCYPDENREQTVYLYNIATQDTTTLGRFYLPPEYKGEWRVDTHPRYNHAGTHVCIDGVAEGQGRQLFLIDIANVVD